MPDPCPDPPALEAFAGGGLDDSARGMIEVHLDRCADCRLIAAELARDWDAADSTLAEGGRPAAGAALVPGDAVGRYRIERRVGEGGMAVVYAARDPELDRHVALKFLKRDHDGDAQRLRVAREAQATARLSHPNVVGVYEVGTHGGAVFIALELVEGVTLSRWIAERRPARKALLDVFVQAGRGLLAAHGAGLVHRDFKPENVLIDRHGRARVTDFGLARPHNLTAAGTVGPGAAREGAPAESRTGRPLTMELTASDVIVGTPAYMAPEQFLGEEASARADQFSFCVSLYEALLGSRPFRGENLAELAASVTAGRLEERPLRALPRWLVRCIRRGLCVEPAERFPSMEALLAELGRDRSVRKRVLTAGALGAGAAGTVGALYLLAVAGVIDRPEPGAPDLELGEVARAAADAGLPGAGDGEPNDEHAAIRSDLRSVEALIRSGRYAGALPIAETSARRAEAAGEGALLAVAHYRIGSLHSYLGDPAAAEKSFIDAHLAGKKDAPEVELAAAVRLVWIIGYAQRRFADAQPWIATAQTLVERQNDAKREATLLGYQSSIAFAQGDYERAEAERRRALAIREEHVGPDHPDVASDLASLAGTLSELGRVEEALELRQRALRIMIAERGRDHPQVSDYVRGMATLLHKLGREEEAYEHWQRALRIRREAYGNRHPDVATSLDDIGHALAARGQHERAAEHFRQALDIRREFLGPRHPNVASTMGNLGRVLVDSELDEAIDLLERAVETVEDGLGERHPALIPKLSNLARAYRRAGRHPAAIASYERVVDIREATLGRDHPESERARRLLAELRDER